MIALIHAELLKLRTVAMTGWLVAASLLFVVLETLGLVLGGGTGANPGQNRDPHLLAVAVASAAAGDIVMLVLGVLVLTHEFRFGAASASFMVEPRRGRVLIAKLIAVSTVSLGVAIVSIAIVVPLSVWLIPAHGGVVTWDRQVFDVLGGVVLVMTVYGPLGLGVAALVRNQIAAIAGGVLWLVVIEQLLIALLPSVGKWLPGGATAAALQLGTVSTTRGELLPQPAAAAMLTAYAAAFAVIGARMAIRRDVV
jgi:hypothetical protein